ncbi:MAG TPA: type VII secretion protein EccE [Pilimelia sp.]|nr:type VII secretion protein EccE [Pilimelia sp.]
MSTSATVATLPVAPRRLPRRGVFFGLRAGQIAAAQAAVALLVAASTAGWIALAITVPAATALVVLAWVRLRHRWLYQWLAVALRYASRRHTLAADSGAGAVLDLVAPGTRVKPAELAGDAAAVLVDAYGVTAVLEVGDAAGLLAESVHPLPVLTGLLPPPADDVPAVRLQLLVAGVPAPVPRAGGATAATSYRQLTEGRLLGQERVLLAVRIPRDDGWATEDLLRTLSGIVRRVRRRLGALPTRPLGEVAVAGVLADLAHHDGAQPAREAWQAVHLGGLLQATFRLTRWPDLRAETARRLVPRLLSLPAAATTVSVTAGPRTGAGEEEATVDLVIRLAAGDAAALNAAIQALRRLLAAEGASARRLDGEHLDGLAATLPLGGSQAPAVPGVPSDGITHTGTLAGLDIPVGGAGLMAGTNRHGAPVLIRLFRREPTRALLVGGVRGAQLVVVRAMALGARIVVQTARPQAWEPFVRGVSAPGESITMTSPGRPVDGPPGTPLHPLLVVVDVGPVGADGLPAGGWQATLIVRDDVAAVDTDALTRADLVMLQPLRPHEAAVVGPTLGLGDAAEWLTRIRQDMIGVVNRRAVRWALLSPTPIELQLIGPPGRA